MSKLKLFSVLVLAGIIVAGSVQAATILFPIGGGTGTKLKPTTGQVLVGQSNGTYLPVATSTLGIIGAADGNFSTTSANYWGSVFATAPALTSIGTSGATTTVGGMLYAATGTIGYINGVLTMDSTYPKNGAGLYTLVQNCKALHCKTIDLLDSKITVTSLPVAGGIELGNDMRITASGSSTITSTGTWSSGKFGVFNTYGENRVTIDHINFINGGDTIAIADNGGDLHTYEYNTFTGTSTAIGNSILWNASNFSTSSTNMLVQHNSFHDISGEAPIYFGHAYDLFVKNPKIIHNDFARVVGPATYVITGATSPMYGLTVEHNTYTDLVKKILNPVALEIGLSNGNNYDTSFSFNTYNNSLTTTQGVVYFYGSNGFKIIGNVMNGSWIPSYGTGGLSDQPAIAPGRTTYPAYHVEIASNKVKGFAAWIDPDSTVDADIHNNEITDGEAIHLGYNTIRYVTYRNNKYYDTTTNNSGTGRYIIGLGNSSQYYGNVIENNEFYVSTSSNLTFILPNIAQDYSGVTIKNNKVYAPNAVVTPIDNSAGASMPRVIEGNEIYDKNGHTSEAGYTFNGGILFLGSTSTAGTTTNTLRMQDSALFWDNTNKRLGIGTTSPYAKLSVSGSVVATLFTATNTTATSSFLGGIVGTGNFVVQSGTGNLGLNKSNPLYKLHISGTSDTPSLSAIGGIAAFDTNSSAELIMGGYNSSPYGLWFQTKDTASSGAGSGLSYPLLLNPIGGKIGIGVTAPKAPLEISSSTSANIGASIMLSNLASEAVGNANSISFRNSSAYSGTPSQLSAEIKSIETSTEFLGDLVFSTYSSQLNEVMRITSGRNVGIGTTSPYSKLSVAGQVVAANYVATDTAATSTLAGFVVLSGLTASAGTPSSVCMNATTKEITVNAALTCTVSARDQKNNIETLSLDALNMVMKLNPVQFKYNDADRLRYGFIADEVQAVDPRLGDAYDKNGNARSIDLPALISINTKAIQDVQKEIDALPAYQAGKRSVELNWIWGVLGLLTLVVVRQQRQIAKLMK